MDGCTVLVFKLFGRRWENRNTSDRMQALQAIGFEMEKGITKRSLRSCTGSEPMLHVPEGRMREIRFTTRGVSLTIHDNAGGDEVKS